MSKAAKLKAVRRMVDMIVGMHPEIPPEDLPKLKRYLYKKLVKQFNIKRKRHDGAQQTGKTVRVGTPTSDTGDGGQDSMGG